ncbi:MAG: HYR domain-containing protein [Verrucomicrobia subdivision 3 bacterium]|nr:HYR domain-containing protein [Limisphaerales bacterium]
MKMHALIAALLAVAVSPVMAAPGLITADASPNVVNVGDNISVTMRIQGYTDPVEIDGFSFDIAYPAGLFTFVAGSFNLGDAAGPDQQWLSKPNQESVAAGYTLTDFNGNPVPGMVHIEMADLGFSMPERGTIAPSGFLVQFKLTAIAQGSGEICARGVPGPAGPEVLYDTNLRRAGVPQFVCSNVVVRTACTNPPVIRCPTNITVWTCSNSIPVPYTVVAASDCCSNVTITCVPPSGSQFPAGVVTPVTCTAVDTCGGNQTNCTFTVRVIPDSAPPVLNCPTNVITRWLCTNRTTLDYTVTATDDCDTNVQIICEPPPGALVNVPGIYNVHCEALDDCGKRDECNFFIRLIDDTTPPEIKCPTNAITLWTCTNKVELRYPVTAMDDCDTNVTIICDPPEGTIVMLPLPAPIPVTCVAIDDCGNRDVCQFSVRIILDDLPPRLDCPTNTLVSWACTNQGPLNYPIPTATDDCDTNVAVVCQPPPTAVVPVPGEYTVTCTATDDCGNRSACEFKVRIIRDTTPPELICPTNIIVKTCYDGERVPYRLRVQDDCDRDVEVRCEPPSGSFFPIGTHEVRCVAVDDCDNRTECKFEVIVMKADPPRLTIRHLAVAPGFVICWPAPSPGFRLQCTRSLNPPIMWETLTNMPVLINNTQWCVTLPNVPRHRFYRLCKPPKPVITSVRPLNPKPNDILFIDGTGFGNNPDDLCVAIAATDIGPTGPVAGAAPGDEIAIILYPARALFADDKFLTARMPGAFPMDARMGRLMVGHGVGHVGKFKPVFDDILVLDDVWTWEKGDSDGMGEDQVQPQPEPPGPQECWFFSGEPQNCALCLYLDPNCPWPSNAIVSITARAHDSLTGAGGYDLDGPTIRFVGGGTILECAERIKDVLRCVFQQQAGVDIEVECQLLSDGRVKITVRIPGGCIDRGFFQVCVRNGNDPVIESIEPTTGGQGTTVLIQGKNFGNNPDNICAVIVEDNPVGADKIEGGVVPVGRRYIPLQALEVGPDHILARLGPVPPNARPGRLMIAQGQGSMARFRPAFSDIIVENDVWTWRPNGQGKALSQQPFVPQPDPPPPPSNCWFYSEAPTDGKLCVFLEPNCPWPTNSCVTVIARAHDATTGVGGGDLAAPNVRFTGGGTLLECAERIKDVLRCAFLQQAGVNVEVACDLLPDGRVKITVTIPGGFITHGMLTICVGTWTADPGGP